MTEPHFDPYYKWLGIPREDQPPNHYQLLGAVLFESDTEVIDSLSMRQIRFVRSVAAGKYADASQKLLNELSAARITLLNPDQKQRYDANLKVALNKPTRTSSLAKSENQKVTPSPVSAIQPLPTQRASNRSPGQATRAQRRPKTILITWLATGILVIVCVGLWRLSLPPTESTQNLSTEIVSNSSVEKATNQDPMIDFPDLAVAPISASQAKRHQMEWARHLSIDLPSTNSIGMEFALIPPGQCTIGTFAFEETEKPAHQITIQQPFELGVCEVTQEQYARLMGNNPSLFQASNNPVENVSWAQAVEFCEKLTALPEEQSEGFVYRLPTEVEWEYACRAGTTTDYSVPAEPKAIQTHAWTIENSTEESHPVGLKSPNPWLLKDMHGNVWEWCLNGFYGYPIDNSSKQNALANTNPIRVQRGGGWNALVDMARSSYRGRSLIHYRGKDRGFRVVRFKKYSGIGVEALQLDTSKQPISVDLLQRINTTQGSLHQDWRKQADGSITANVNANHDTTTVPVEELISTSPYGLVIDFGNVGRRTGVPRFSIKCPYDENRRIIVRYYYGRSYNLSVGVEGAGSISTRHFLGYRDLAIHVTEKYVEASLNGEVFGRIDCERGSQTTKQEDAKIEFSGISGSWMHFHIRSAQMLLDPAADAIND